LYQAVEAVLVIQVVIFPKVGRVVVFLEAKEGLRGERGRTKDKLTPWRWFNMSL
jgi:hypothetical protein